MQDYNSTACQGRSQSYARHKEIFAVALFGKKVEVKEFRNRLGVAQRVPGGLGSQIS